MAATLPTLPTGLKLTREEYGALPEDGPLYQLIDERLIGAPSPSDHHQDIAGTIYAMLRLYLDMHPIGYVRIAPLDVHLGEHDVYQPDVVFVSKARRAILKDHGIEGGPDLVVEVLSPSTRHLTREPSGRPTRSPGSVNFGWSIRTTDRSASST